MVFINLKVYFLLCGEWWSGGFYPHKTKPNNSKEPEWLAKCADDGRQAFARLVEGVRRDAGAAGKVRAFGLGLG